MSSKAKRKAEPERKSLRKVKKVKYGEDTESDASGGDEFNGENDIEEELQGLATSNIIQGRRTRGVKVDYTKVDGFPGSDEEVDEYAEVGGGMPYKKKLSKEKPSKDKARAAAKPTSNGKKKKDSASSGKASTSVKVTKTVKPPIRAIPPKPKKRAVYESEIDEESDGHISEGAK